MVVTLKVLRLRVLSDITVHADDSSSDDNSSVLTQEFLATMKMRGPFQIASGLEHIVGNI